MVSNSISAISSSRSASNSLLIELVCSIPAVDFSLYRASFCTHADQAKVPGRQRKRKKEITPRAIDFNVYPDFINGLVIFASFFTSLRWKSIHFGIVNGILRIRKRGEFQPVKTVRSSSHLRQRKYGNTLKQQHRHRLETTFLKKEAITTPAMLSFYSRVYVLNI